MLSRAAVVGTFVLGLLLTACGGGAAAGASLDDPISVVQGYMTAVAGGDKNGGLPYLETDINDGIALTDSTTASRFMAAHKGSKWSIVTVNYPPPGSSAPAATKKACTVIPPQGGELCIITVQVDAGNKPVWFHFSVEKRYGSGWHILDVDQVDTKPDNLLPTGNEAHTA